MISKKLWSKITGFDLPTHLKIYGKKDVTAVVGDEMISINIYELMHLAKEWAYKQGYSISIMREVDEDKLWYYDIWGMDMLLKHESSLNKSEPEAIFKACEWIEENKSSQGL